MLPVQIASAEDAAQVRAHQDMTEPYPNVRDLMRSLPFVDKCDQTLHRPLSDAKLFSRNIHNDNLVNLSARIAAPPYRGRAVMCIS
ncbi:MAG TPA: hypothetical protein VM008_17740 [Phycisphaerae bacterium]|nr:hypothetical protein [Phycisphaerae bacterium]